MRISDWSSDVCSSDLLAASNLHGTVLGDHRPARCRPAGGLEVDHAKGDVAQRPSELVETALRLPLGRPTLDRSGLDGAAHVPDARRGHRQTGSAAPHRLGMRSEEHTSELQSLMRLSYAVFCLKKKTALNSIH